MTPYLPSRARTEIEGSKPCPPWVRYLRGRAQRDRAPLETIKGSTPRTLYPNVNRPVDLSMKTDDIDGATKTPSVQHRWTRHTNPLDPTYHLATSRPCRAETLTPRFLRPSNYVADIDGTACVPSGLRSARCETYSLRTDDIRYATPRRLHHNVTQHFSVRDYRDQAAGDSAETSSPAPQY